MALLFCVFLGLIQVSVQYSVRGGLSHDRMVSEGWSDDILTDGWNGVPRGCGGKPADIYFVLDTSEDTSPEALANYRRYLSDLAALFHLHQSGTRLAVMTFGHAPFTTTPLGTYSALPKVQSAVNTTPRVGGSRRTAQALKYLRQTGFSPLVSRQGVAQVVILMTNGYSADAKQTAQEASALRKQGVYVYTVSDASSGRVDKGELLEMASEPAEKFVFSSDDWQIVNSLIELLRIKECNYQVLPPLPGKEPVCVSRRPTEIAFAVEHLGLGSPKAQRIIAFIQDLLAEVDPDSDIKAAILTSKDPISQHALSRRVNTIQLLEQTLGGVTFPDLSQLLRRARRMLNRRSDRQSETWDNNTKKSQKPTKKVSDDVQKVLLVFMDDSVRITKKTLAAAKANHNSKLDTYVVYIEGEEKGKRRGRGADMQEIRMLANGDDHVIRIPSYRLLRSQNTVVDTLQTICRGL